MYQFFPKQSRIFDFLSFPKILVINEEIKESEIKNISLDDDEYRELIKKIKNSLKPFAKEIEFFYTNDYLSSYNIIELFLKIESIFNYEKELDYLNHLVTLNDHEIRTKMIHAILLLDQQGLTKADEDELLTQAKEIISDKEKLLDFIKNTPIEASFKWNLFLIIENPVSNIKKYKELMLQLLPIFNEYYTPFEDRINQYGTHFVDFLNQNGAEGIEKISHSTLNRSIIQEKNTKFMISLMFSYMVSITNDIGNASIIWGLKMEEAFKFLKEMNEDKLNRRVQIFKNLGDKTRYEVLKLIASGVTSTKEIANTLGVSSATISYHINAFLTTKIITLDKNKKIDYVIDFNLLEENWKELMEDLRFSDKK